MKLSAVLLAFAIASTVDASALLQSPAALAARHSHVARSSLQTSSSKHLSKRCKARNHQNASTPSPPPTNNAANNLVIQVQSNCGPSGATPQSSATTGPNGSLDWLNCGINDSGWNPPYIRIQDLVVKSLTDSLNSGNSPFEKCRPFVQLFEQYGAQFGVPSILIASFAMQESTCNPETVGGAGEQGLMQLTWDKCGDAPGGNCRDPDYNVRTGARFISQLLGNYGGSVLLTIGHYNGWVQGMTYGQATAAAYTDCCRCQNNLDYLHQFVNGWLQNINSYDKNHPLGKYFNLNVCNN